MIEEPIGTQVLIPVACGLIELFSTKHNSSGNMGLPAAARGLGVHC
ncbi:hypothetical protein OROMI_001256 [Orobanche minor]